MLDTLPEVDTDECPCRRCETFRLVQQRLESIIPLKVIETRLDGISEDILAIKPNEGEKLNMLLTGGSCSQIRATYIDAMAQLILLRMYHLTIGNALIEHGCFPEEIAGWTSDTARLDAIIELLEHINV